jgi:hypothetical protein
VETGTVTFDDSFLDPTAITADAQSGVVARRGFQAQAAYRNGDGAPGADLRVATLDGAVLQQATAGSDGRAPPLPLEVFRLASGTLAQGADLLVRGVLGNLQNETRVARGAALPRTILWDATPPSALTGLRRTSADNVAQVALAWEAATDDHLPPRYAVEVASLAGHPAQPVKLAQTATTTSATVALPAQGLYRVNVTAVDRSGNRGATQGLLVAWDTEAPTLAPTLGGTQGKGGWYGTDVTITPNASDAVTGIASTAVREGGANVPAQTLGNEGVHAITVAATDFAGNTATAALTVRIDRTAPVPPALALAHAATRQSGLVQADLLGNATDNLSGVVELRVLRMANGTATVLERLLPPFASQVNLQPVDGDNALLLEAEDGAGNTARSATVHLSVDLAGPKPLGPLPSKATDGRIQLAFEDPSGVASLEAYDGTRLLASSRSGNLEVPVSGVDRVTVVAVDGLGNEARYDVSLAGAAAAPAVGPLAALLLLGLAAIWGRRESL